MSLNENRSLVERFYAEVWDHNNDVLARDILTEDFMFRGSLGLEKAGPDGFILYMRMIHGALENYRCIIEDMIVSDNRVAAWMRFQGQHEGTFFGVRPTHKQLIWNGAAFFTIREGRISELKVMGDVDSVKQQLGLSQPIGIAA